MLYPFNAFSVGKYILNLFRVRIVLLRRTIVMFGKEICSST